ncbi:MAG: dTMP kinase [Verrucomicrobiales bacterium]|nr:dTMP kinase [Verrucomicrobiales bacterium]
MAGEARRHRGVFISFEGGEGCGKSTQVRRLLQRLGENAQDVLPVREPGGTAVGEVIRHLLQHTPEAANMTAESELLLFAASRAQLVREKIRPALAAGCHVVADRFWDSTTVYQGAGRQLAAQAVAFINRFAVGDCVPDITFLLDIPVTDGLARARSRTGVPDRMEAAGTAFHEAVREGYLMLAAENPDRIVRLDATRDADSLADAIRQTLTERFYGVFR